MNRKGQLMALYFVVLTTIMIFTVLGFYIKHQSNAAGTLISPKTILEIQDELEIFELREAELIEQTAQRLIKQDMTYNSDTFKQTFKQELINNYPETMKTFILDQLTVDGKAIPITDFNNFLENKLYQNINYDQEEQHFIIQRSEIGKTFPLEAEKKNQIGFDVDFSFTFTKTYKLNNQGKII